ncbi:tRNA (adenosine(37)-N6)-threonylcarbamoyltransferase complex dimerization subunit type 1 TsaB [Candidatus Peregrinibacteria bacterium CG_4_9_14_0_2_um_filter_53_11]|nr:MAG: tRNA (adenosine(37)-N6)-threonylcarbamoyltransferase complex dimerization subunit type 1 TsaB [Candidatus Peregrinibacteria bacterium CG_4_9_14_0_2_um_filter_53_11]
MTLTTLALNTASLTESVALLKDGFCVAEKSWRGNSDESELLLPAITSVLQEAESSFSGLDRILVVEGPGPFSAVRIGVTVAMTLSFSLNIPIVSIETPALWAARLPQSPEKQLFLMHAGRRYVAHAIAEGASEESLILPVAELIEKLTAEYGKGQRIELYGDLLPEVEAHLIELLPNSWRWRTQKELLSFGTTLSGLPERLIKAHEGPIVEPRYLRPPNITPAKNV